MNMKYEKFWYTVGEKENFTNWPENLVDANSRKNTMVTLDILGFSIGRRTKQKMTLEFPTHLKKCTWDCCDSVQNNRLEHVSRNSQKNTHNSEIGPRTHRHNPMRITVKQLRLFSNQIQRSTGVLRPKLKMKQEKDTTVFKTEHNTKCPDHANTRQIRKLSHPSLCVQRTLPLHSIRAINPAQNPFVLACGLKWKTGHLPIASRFHVSITRMVFNPPLSLWSLIAPLSVQRSAHCVSTNNQRQRLHTWPLVLQSKNMLIHFAQLHQTQHANRTPIHLGFEEQLHPANLEGNCFSDEFSEQKHNNVHLGLQLLLLTSTMKGTSCHFRQFSVRRSWPSRMFCLKTTKKTNSHQGNNLLPFDS